MVLPILLSERLRLRPWTALDGAAFHTLWGDGRVIWWGPTESPAASGRQLASILARCAAMPAGLGWWAVEALGTETLLGNAVLQPAPYDDTVELGYHLMHAAWGQGYATEAARAVLHHGFEALGLPVISAVVHIANTPSHRVIERLGLRATGPITHAGLPHTRYDLTREAWAGLEG